MAMTPAKTGRWMKKRDIYFFASAFDASGAAPRIEAMLPAGGRARQLSVRTLLAGLCLAQADHRPAHLTRVHQAHGVYVSVQLDEGLAHADHEIERTLDGE